MFALSKIANAAPLQLVKSYSSLIKTQNKIQHTRTAIDNRTPCLLQKDVRLHFPAVLQAPCCGTRNSCNASINDHFVLRLAEAAKTQSCIPGKIFIARFGIGNNISRSERGSNGQIIVAISDSFKAMKPAATLV